MAVVLDVIGVSSEFKRSPEDYLEAIERLLGMVARKEAEVTELRSRLKVQDLVLELGRMLDRPPADWTLLMVGIPNHSGDVLRTLFLRTGFQAVHQASNTAEALGYLELHRPRAALVEAVDEATGQVYVEMLQALRDRDPLLRIVAVLPSNDAQDLRQAVLSGASEVIVKPLHTGRLVDLMTGLMAHD